MKAWLRWDEYKEWSDRVYVQVRDFCPQCPIDIPDDGRIAHSEHPEIGWVKEVSQHCEHQPRALKLPVPTRFISLEEITND